MADTKTPKANACEALAQVHGNLARELTPVQQVITRGLVEYALEQLGQVQELKIKRRATRKEPPHG
jgi:hypothetical protein